MQNRAGDALRPLRAVRCSVNTGGVLLRPSFLRSEAGMTDGGLSSALDRAERALARIEQALSQRAPSEGRDDQLRERVREAIAELDQLIREASSG